MKNPPRHPIIDQETDNFHFLDAFSFASSNVIKGTLLPYEIICYQGKGISLST